MGDLGRDPDQPDGFGSPWPDRPHNDASPTPSSVAKTDAFATSSLFGLRTNGAADDGAIGANGNGLPLRPTPDLSSRPSTGYSSGASALDALGRDVKQLMDAIQKLRILGFETSVVSLPKIVVIGDQSTGKSSVIEGISGIKVPRSVGTCTRCPLEINLSYSEEPWACKVFLSRRYMYTETAKATSVGAKHPFGPWEPLDSQDETEFATLGSKDNVADALRWAQLATLNPGTNPQLYRPGNNDGTMESNQVEFSPNVVRLDISGPELTNLAFYDLPGLISHVADERDQYLVKLVENLAKEYMKSEETIILLTLTMNHDVQNSKAAGMIQRYKAEDRTLGVFTKPDLMSPEAEEMFTRVLAGQNFKRQLGYFAVKNNPRPDVDHATARAEEKIFFNKWCRDFPQLSRYRTRFGTDVLTRELSKLLAIRIRCSMPKIREIIDKKIEEFESQLESLPRPPAGNLSLEISNNITALGRELELLFESNANNSGNPKRASFKFFEEWQTKTRQYRNMMVQSHPRLSLDTDNSNSLAATSRSPMPSRETAEVIQIDDDEMESTTPAPPPRTPGTGRKRQINDPETSPAKRVRTGDASNSAATNKAKVFTLEQVRNIIASKDDTGMPGAQNPSVTKDIFGQSIPHWRSTTSEYLNASHKLCGGNMMNSIRRVFAKQAGTPLMDEVERKSKDFIKERFKDHQQFAIRCLNMEATVMTLGSTAIEIAKNAAMEEMKLDRNRQRAIQIIEGDDAVSDAVRAKRIELAMKGKNNDLGPDEYERELLQIATVRGYYGYAANRLAEYVSLSFRSEAFSELRDKLCPHLTTELRLNEEDANDHIRKLLEVDPAVAAQRTRCEQELVRLRNGLEEIIKLENSGENTDTSWDLVSTQSTIL